MMLLPLVAFFSQQSPAIDKTFILARKDASSPRSKAIEEFVKNPDREKLAALETGGWIVQTQDGRNYVIDPSALGLSQMQFQFEVYELLRKSSGSELIPASSAGALGEVVRGELRNGFMLGSAMDGFEFHMTVNPASNIIVSDGDQRMNVFARHGTVADFPPPELLAGEKGEDVEKFELFDYVRPYGKEFLEIFVKSRDPLKQAIARKRMAGIIEELMKEMSEKLALERSKANDLWSRRLAGIDEKLIDSPLQFGELQQDEQDMLSSIFLLNSKTVSPTTKIIDIQRYVIVRVNVKTADGKGLPQEFSVPLE